jgi:hypothetical protein
MVLRMATSTNSLRNLERRVALAVILGLMVVLIHDRLNGPRPDDTPGGFSAAEAFDELKSRLAEGVPHPVESPANRVVRDRIIQRFHAFGYYSPVIQKARACSHRWGKCANVENIVVLPPTPGDIVLGVAHYDSVPAGPGASDDGEGVATMLECARLLRDTRTRNPIGFLITDGEEAGLLGAEAFVADPVLSRNVRAVVNVENRGTSGPSYLFETSVNNRDLVPLFNRLDRPITTSVFYTVYTLLPNDTDVTVFKRAGKIAVNFAAIGSVKRYHSKSDDLVHVDLKTLQHHGDNALAMLRALGAADLQHFRKGNDVFFDILGFFVVYWPDFLTVWIALASLAVLIVLMRGVAVREIAIGALRFLAAIIIAAIVGVIAMKVTPHRLANPGPAIVLMWIAGIASTLLLTRGRPWQGRSLVLHIIAIALAVTLPGLSFLFLVPAIAMNVPGRPFVAAPIAAIVLFPLGLVLYTALGSLALPVVAVLLAFAAATFTE